MNKAVATREAYGKALLEAGRENENIVVLDADLSKSTKTNMFAGEFPNRFFDMGIAEQNMMAVAAGLAASGKIPFASTFAVFASGRAFEIIRNSICYPKLNVKICATHAGITVGEDGATHQALEDIACMRALPNMVVINPSDGVSTEAAIKAIAEYKGPVYVRLGRAKVPVIYDENNFKFEIGKGIEVKEGSDITIIATGIMVSKALQASEKLSEEGISARVIDIHTIKPIDKDIIVKAANETKAIITVEEHNIIGGLGSAVAEVLAENCPVPMKRIGINDTFGESGKPDELMEKYGLTAENIIENAKQLIGK
ncbi:transketolase [Caminicella sporogenes DSM 14501]|uniref:Transketolase n=1 Tax=Caminicella sporogenes DSM 14501 TaxID=1121266 RepID=A0A1M6QHD9_9FIRM|nr:transketolase family protein [Caminicella sporogenes]RKD25312.1 transketolase [Caminicella sporogenes]SHK19598.1 transketolase [Caminicella sporogenes DSM 14501]